MPKLRESRPPDQGQQHTYSLDPGPDPGCEVSWLIDGQPVGLGSKVGGLEVKGFGAAGTMTVEVTGNFHDTTVTAKIRCPEQPLATIGPMLVGAHVWDPCEEPPCHIARVRYQQVAASAVELADGLAFFCLQFRHGLLIFLAMLGIFVPVLLAVLFCQTIHLEPIFCQALYVALAVATILMLWALGFFGLRFRIFRERMQACREARAEMQQLYRIMRDVCPKECQPPEVTVECRCR
jgi:hypothetical protein